MNTLELFEFENFEGDSTTLDSDTPDLAIRGFLQKAKSLKVHGDPWIVFSGVKYDCKGSFQCFTERSYPSIPSWANKISSARIVRGGLYPHKITLYEHIYYGGKAVPLEKAADSLKTYGFENMASSHKAVTGAWILYSEEYYKGDQMVTVAGDCIEDYRKLDWNDKVSSVKPINDKCAFSVSSIDG